MPRFYVKNDKGLWNIYSTIIDGYLYDDFIEFEDIKAKAVGETVIERLKELDSLLTEKPKLNTMAFEEAERKIADMWGEE